MKENRIIFLFQKSLKQVDSEHGLNAISWAPDQLCLPCPGGRERTGVSFFCKFPFPALVLSVGLRSLRGVCGS